MGRAQIRGDDCQLRPRIRRRGPPDQQALLDHGDDHVDDEHEGGQHEHAGENAGHVKHALRLLNEVTEPGGGAQIFAHHRAHHGKAHRGV